MIASCVLCCHVLSCGTLNDPVLVNVSHATVFVIVFVKFRTATISFNMSVCLSVFPRGAAWFLLNGFS